MRCTRIVAIIAALVASALLVPGAALAAATTAPGPPSGPLVIPSTHLDLSQPGQQIILSFDGTAGERLFLFEDKQDGNTPDISFDLYEPADAGGAEFVNDAYAIDSGTTLPSSGTFTIVFYASDGSSTVSTDVATDLSANVDGGELQPGQAVTNQTTHRGQQILYHFAGQAGQRPTVTATSQSFGDAFVEFIRPDGTEETASDDDRLGQNSYTFAEGSVLDETGTWTMVIDPDPDSFGSQSIVFNLVQDAAISPIPPHRATRLAVGTPGVNIARSFRMAKGQKLVLSVTHLAISQARGIQQLPANPLVAFRVRAPNGQMLSRNIAPAGPAYAIPERQYVGIAPQTGRYTLEMDPTHNTVGAVATRIDQFSDKQVGASIGVPIPVAVREPTQTTTATFPAEKGQQLSVTVTHASWLSGTRPCHSTSTCRVYAYLEGPNDYSQYLGDATSNRTLTAPKTLPSSGGYELLIIPAAPFGFYVTGSATLTINASG